MAKRIHISTDMSPAEVLDRLRANTADSAEVLESLKGLRGPFIGVLREDQPIISEIEGKRFRLRFQGGRAGPNPSRQHFDGSVEPMKGGSRIHAEPKGFVRNEMGSILICAASIVTGIIFGLMLRIDPSLGFSTFAILAGFGGIGMFPIWAVIDSQQRLFSEFLARLFDGSRQQLVELGAEIETDEEG